MSVDINFLTSKQKKVYSAIESFIKARGIPPTVREIGEMIGEKTPGAVQGILNRLEQKGVIKREMGMARSIQLVTEDSQYITPLYIPIVKKISERNINDLFNIYNIEKYCPIPPSICNSVESSFIISCPDNSLADSGIRYEDHLIIDRNAEVKDGDIIILMYEGHVLLRYFKKHDNPSYVILKADSDLIGKEEFNADDITIIGKLIGKYTNYN